MVGHLKVEDVAHVLGQGGVGAHERHVALGGRLVQVEALVDALLEGQLQSRRRLFHRTRHSTVNREKKSLTNQVGEIKRVGGTRFR